MTALVTPAGTVLAVAHIVRLDCAMAADIEAGRVRFSPYAVTFGGPPADLTPYAVTFEEAIDVLADIAVRAFGDEADLVDVRRSIDAGLRLRGWGPDPLDDDAHPAAEPSLLDELDDYVEPAPAPGTVCDGDHAAPSCEARQCWHLDPEELQR